ncbi:Pol protein [Phytophthora palmivora]|uniref:Pol protein n=1 Tax=Phytophthora palmivora TaxID=4796 RepID=A0A2P4XPP0_9STRA|nr:Pol protein [Phytophthora palmivora]
MQRAGPAGGQRKFPSKPRGSMEEAIQIALQEEYSHRHARTPTSVWQDHKASTDAVQGTPAARASTGPVPMELGTAVQSSIRCYGCGKLGHMQRAGPAGGQRKFPSKPRGSRGPWQKPRPKSQGNWGHQSADGARHGGLAPESLGALETRKSSGGLLGIHASVRGCGDPFRILIDSGALTNFARRQTVAQNSDKLADALHESEDRGQVSVRLTNGTVVNFEDFDSTESSLVLDMDKYDSILGMPWLEKHEPWIDWRGKAIGASRPAVSDRVFPPLDGRQGAYAPEEVLGDTDAIENVAMSLATGHETKAHCQACGIATTASPNAESRRAVWASTVAVPDGTDHAGKIGPQAAEAAEEDAESASGVGNIVPRGVKKTSTRAEVLLNTSRVDNKAPHSESETPPARPVEEQCHVFDGVSGRQVRAGAVHLEALLEVSALLILEELSMKDFLTELKAREIAEMVLLKPETSTEDLDPSSVMDEDCLEGFTKQRATRLGSEILKNVAKWVGRNC